EREDRDPDLEPLFVDRLRARSGIDRDRALEHGEGDRDREEEGETARARAAELDARADVAADRVGELRTEDAVAALLHAELDRAGVALDERAGGLDAAAARGLARRDRDVVSLHELERRRPGLGGDAG